MPSLSTTSKRLVGTRLDIPTLPAVVIVNFALLSFAERAEVAIWNAPDDVEALLGLAKALEQAERWRKSRNYYMELIDKDPNDPQYYYGVYRTYFGEGRLEDAQEYLNKATVLRGN